MATRRLHIHYASQNHYNSLQSNLHDIEQATTVGAHIIGFDELIAAKSHLPAIARRNGYRAVTYPGIGGQEAFFVREDFPVSNRGWVQVTPPLVRSSRRYISWCRVNWYGQYIWPHAAHWMIEVGETGHVSNASRGRYHTKITDAMIRHVHDHGKNPNLAFFMGDTNVSEVADNHINDHRLINYRFNKAGLRTIWDELRVFPGTHGRRTIDIIGKYDPTNRVDGVRYKVWPKRNSDHRPISAYYDIEMTKPVSSGGGGTTGGGGTPRPPTPHNYKWWDYSDYLDNDISHVDYAIDDSGETESGE